MTPRTAFESFGLQQATSGMSTKTECFNNMELKEKIAYALMPIVYDGTDQKPTVEALADAALDLISKDRKRILEEFRGILVMMKRGFDVMPNDPGRLTISRDEWSEAVRRFEGREDDSHLTNF
jgi:hypothetical protein